MSWRETGKLESKFKVVNVCSTQSPRRASAFPRDTGSCNAYSERPLISDKSLYVWV